MTYPNHIKQILGAAWTAADPTLPYRHFVVEFVTKAGDVQLEAVLDRGYKMSLPWRDLRDRARWTPGWA